MSVEIAVHAGGRKLGGGGSRSHSRLERARAGERPLARLLTFAALGLYGVLRWATLLHPVPGLRLLGLLALAALVAGGGAKLDRRSRPLAVVLALAAVAAMLAISGVPIGWLFRLRVALISQGIGQALAGLPGVLVPYVGIDPWVRLVIVLGAGVLLLDGALLLAFSPQTLSDVRRAAAALPLIALAIVPSTLARPQLPYLQGLVLFCLIAAFMWSERTVRHHAAGAVAVVGLAGVCAVALAPKLDQHRPWVNYQGLAGSLTPAHVESFDWAQSYGPLNWPQHGREVLDVRAAHPDYWKAENLDLFNGLGWTQGSGIIGSQLPAPAPAAMRIFTQRLEVTIRAMQTPEVITAGFAAPPDHIGEGAVPGVSPGTWTAGAPLGPGDSYTVSTYSPRPTAAELRAAGDRYPSGGAADELTLQLPVGSFAATRPEVKFAPFHSGAPIANVVGPYSLSGLRLLADSPYVPAYRLATRLAASAGTPYAFVQSIERYLSSANGFRYDQNPPSSPYPLESFLFSSKRGYCQQFAGAMALLVRMGGVPARVVTGFTTGRYNATTHQYVVSDLDAHAWVEVWFPYWGWVRFDPTPATAATPGGGTSLLANAGLSGSSQPAVPGSHGIGSGPAAKTSTTHHGGPGAALLIGVLAVLLALCAGAVIARRRAAPASAERLVAELERAHSRCGRPLPGGATLASLERRLRFSPDAERYVRALRMARFAGGQTLPCRRGRRALRRQLAADLGLSGWLRAWWALPPRPRFPSERS